MADDAVIVIAPNWLGDAVMALPAIADVRRAFSSARLIVAARRAVAGLFRLVPSVDEVMTLEWRGRLFERGALARDVTRVRDASPRAAILLPNSFATAWLMRRAGVAERWGYATDLRRPLLSRPIAVPSGSMHQGRYYQHLVQALGIDNGPLEPAVVAPPQAIAEARTLLAQYGWNAARPLIVMAPGAAYGTAKRWPPHHFAGLAESVIERLGADCVLVGGDADASTTAQVRGAVRDAWRGRVIDLAGKTDLATLAAVLSLARVCVANDSGAMHLAAAAGAPVVALFGPTREFETAPLARASVGADVLINPVWCRPCMLRECPIDHRCMRGLTPPRVGEAVVARAHRSSDSASNDANGALR